MPAQYDVPSAWGQSPFQELELPSGGKILAKRIDLPAIAAANLIDEFDKFSPTVDEKVVQPAKGKRPSDRPAKKPTKKDKEAAEAQALREFFKKDNIDALTGIMDRLLPQIVIRPKIHSTQLKDESGKWFTIEPDDREDGVIYVDSIPFADQMHIFGFGMEGMDMDGLQSFREQSEPTVAVVAPEPKPADSPE
jgi:hypothetical protein